MKLLSILGLAIALASTAWTQSATVHDCGRLSGTIIDSSGAVVPGATITISGGKVVGKHAPYAGQQKANDDGKFSFTQLPAGFYEIVIVKPPFKNATVKAIEVVAGKTSSIRIGLVTLKEAQVVECSDSCYGSRGVAYNYDLTSPSVVTNTDVAAQDNLPLRRSVDGLFYTGPGVSGP